MIHEVQLGRSCDSLRVELGKEIVLGMEALLVADSVIVLQRRQIELRDQAAAVQGDRILNQQQENQALRKQLRRNKIKTLIVGAAGVLAVLIAL